MKSLSYQLKNDTLNYLLKSVQNGSLSMFKNQRLIHNVNNDVLFVRTKSVWNEIRQINFFAQLDLTAC